jgi:hypothetical protein
VRWIYETKMPHIYGWGGMSSVCHCAFLILMLTNLVGNLSRLPHKHMKILQRFKTDGVSCTELIPLSK